MDLTAEQKLLIAFAINQVSGITRETLDLDCKAGQLFDACKEYIDQFREGTEKVDATELHGCDCSIPNPVTGEMPIEKWKCGDSREWKPEVGKLYKRTCNGVVTEVTKVFFDNNGKLKTEHRVLGYKYDNCCAHCDFTSDFCREYEPIAELEGLEEGDKVWSYGGTKSEESANTHEWKISDKDAFETLNIEFKERYLTIHKTGSCVGIGNGKQLFWRTADRAERFGKVQS